MSSKYMARKGEVESVRKRMRREAREAAQLEELKREEKKRIRFQGTSLARRSEPFLYDANCECGTQKHRADTDDSFSGLWIGCDRCSDSKDVETSTTDFHLECTFLCAKYPDGSGLEDVKFLCKFCRHYIQHKSKHPEDTVDRTHLPVEKWMIRYTNEVQRHSGSQLQLAEKMSSFRARAGEDMIDESFSKASSSAQNTAKQSDPPVVVANASSATGTSSGIERHMSQLFKDFNAGMFPY